jgi:hypothetical protein
MFAKALPLLLPILIVFFTKEVLLSGEKGG